ncbi:type IV pilin protein [Pseudomonas sp. F1_0610]|uniref:type IV pilin protein n=1 Tax=Pseudomonas sp. F1_0610 TaxID=3114284 RepID=UPI0039C29745
MQKGFTLIELLVVVAIVGILGAIGYPNYVEYTLKTDRTEGKAHIMAVLTAQERYFNQHMSYTTDWTTLGIAKTSETGRYELRLVKCSNLEIAQCINVQATPKRSDPNCGVLSMDNRGIKTASGNKRAEQYCW